MRASVVAVALAAAGCSGPSVASVYGGAAHWAVIEAPETVKAYRVIRPGVLKHIRAPETIDGWEIVAGPVAVDPATAREITAVLADRATYDFDRAKGCEFDPGVALRFAKADT